MLTNTDSNVQRHVKLLVLIRFSDETRKCKFKSIHAWLLHSPHTGDLPDVTTKPFIRWWSPPLLVIGRSPTRCHCSTGLLVPSQLLSEWAYLTLCLAHCFLPGLWFGELFVGSSWRPLKDTLLDSYPPSVCPTFKQTIISDLPLWEKAIQLPL